MFDQLAAALHGACHGHHVCDPVEPDGESVKLIVLAFSLSGRGGLDAKRLVELAEELGKHEACG